MADIKITALVEDTSPTFDDLLVMVDDPDGSPVTRKISIRSLPTTLGWVDVRSFMDGQSGRPTYATWYANQATTDVTAVIQAAIAAATGKVFFSPGIFKYTSAITGIGSKIIQGSGWQKTILKPTGCHGFDISGETVPTVGDEYTRVSIRDLEIYGDDSGSWNGINYSGNLYSMCEPILQNILISHMGGRGIYIDALFNSTLINIRSTLCGDNLLEIAGGNTVTLMGCYMGEVAAGKAGYRIWDGSTLIGCNGIDGGATWGHFGKSTGGNEFAIIHLINCNIEGFTGDGIKVDFGGRINMDGGNITPAATYDYLINASATCWMSTWRGVVNNMALGSTSKVAPLKQFPVLEMDAPYGTTALTMTDSSEVTIITLSRISEFDFVDDGVNKVGMNLKAAIFGSNVVPDTNDTYYLGKNDDDTPLAWKGVILKDTTNGKIYRIETINGVVTATDLTD